MNLLSQLTQLNLCFVGGDLSTWMIYQIINIIIFTGLTRELSMAAAAELCL